MRSMMKKARTAPVLVKLHALHASLVAEASGQIKQTVRRALVPHVPGEINNLASALTVAQDALAPAPAQESNLAGALLAAQQQKEDQEDYEFELLTGY
jgi:hypothetical protein